MPSETLVGATLAGYTLQALVGEGGTSTVYKAHHPEHGQVAVKVLRDKLRQDPTAVKRFVREAEFGTRVTHPNIIRTIEFGEAPVGSGAPQHYLVIEWAPGEILEKYAKRHAPLPAAEVAEIVRQICAAVQAAHDLAIVHRDLKPENVMYEASSRVVKVLDFGIAADTDAAPDQRLTRAGFFVGTLMYVAPEALSGEMVGPEADQYSLATIAYYLLSGALPYSGKSPRELFQQLLTDPPLPLTRTRAGGSLGPAIEGVVMRGLSRAPKQRFPSVAAFADALGRAASTPVVATAPGAASGPESESGLFSKVRGLFRKG
ncbi:MAG: serine/threonine protein kinase [Gemmatimonadaceae bacterium]|nr:serine/threonine protein kinase [Gemmatimonadaceae bacterium]